MIETDEHVFGKATPPFTRELGQNGSSHTHYTACGCSIAQCPAHALICSILRLVTTPLCTKLY